MFGDVSPVMPLCGLSELEHPLLLSGSTTVLACPVVQNKTGKDETGPLPAVKKEKKTSQHLRSPFSSTN